jgi:spoIIIJ-associated protein
MSEYQEFTGRSVEEAIRAACETFDVGLADLDFEILTPGSRGVLGMGAEPARIVAAPRRALGGAAPKREAAEATPLAQPAPREERGHRDRGPRREERTTARSGGDRGPRREERGPRRDEGKGRGGSELSAAEVAQVTTARGSVAMERAELEAAEATPEALAAGREILEALMGHLGFSGVRVEVREGETSRLNVVGDGSDREALGSRTSST